MTAVAAIVGATAVGKTEIAIEVAERLGAEIVSVDSMQIYRGMDAGTAKPSPELRARVPHHLIDLREPSQAVTVVEYQRLGRAVIDEVSARRRLPLLVGGSGLYWRAIVDDLEFPPSDPIVRARLESVAVAIGPEALHARLAARDARAAERIEPANARRTVRALEVIELTGRRFSDFSANWDRYESRYDLAVAGLSRERSDLYERIAARVDRMIEAGLIEEARSLAEKGLSVTARQALGYRQVLEAPPGAPVGDIRAEIVRATKRFVRRQESWFRADSRVAWFDASRPDTAESLVAHIERHVTPKTNYP